MALFSAFLALKLCMISSLSRGHLTNFNLMLLLFRTQAFTLEDLLEAGKNKYVGVVGSNRASGSFFQRTPFGNTFRKELKRMQSRPCLITELKNIPQKSHLRCRFIVGCLVFHRNI